jgi:glyoxylase-like metal-dependent hydrolase (beta-lactamase superfamily II)
MRPIYQFALGDITVSRIDESVEPAVEPFSFLPELPADAIDQQRSWLEPTFYDGASARLILAEQSWLVRTPRLNILIEACAGNHKSRPHFPRAHMLNTPWLARLAGAGCRPEDINVVLCTHLHVDHVGWFTRKLDGRWIPTFPHARYVIDRIEYANWHPDGRTLPYFQINDGCFEDSVAPVMEAGLMDLVDVPHEIDTGVRILPARGHTMGHVAIEVSSGGKSALFVGDAMHTPLQILYPQCCTYSCEDKPRTIATHHALMEKCIEHDRLFVPTHFPHPHSAVRIRERSGRYAFAGHDGAPVKGLAEGRD